MTPVEPRILRTPELSADALRDLRSLMDRAFTDFSDADWQHALGGWHAVIDGGGRAVAHAAVVPRAIGFGEVRLTVGYVEALAVDPQWQGRGLGSAVMRAAAAIIDAHFPAGVLSTGEAAFYRRLGWEVWPGSSHVRSDGRTLPTPDDDGGIMVRFPASSPVVRREGTIVCEHRDGDVW